MINKQVFISGLLFVVAFVGIQLFRNQNISTNDLKNYSIVFITAFVLIIGSLLWFNPNIEHFADATVATAPTISNEGLQNLASMYNNGNLTVSSLTVTGKSVLQGDTAITGNTTMTGNSTITGNSAVTGNATVGGTATITGKTSLLGDTNIGKNITMFADPNAQDKLQIKPDGNAPGYLYFNKSSALGLYNVPSALSVGADTTINGNLIANNIAAKNDLMVAQVMHVFSDPKAGDKIQVYAGANGKAPYMFYNGGNSLGIFDGKSAKQL